MAARFALWRLSPNREWPRLEKPPSPSCASFCATVMGEAVTAPGVYRPPPAIAGARGQHPPSTRTAVLPARLRTGRRGESTEPRAIARGSGLGIHTGLSSRRTIPLHDPWPPC